MVSDNIREETFGFIDRVTELVRDIAGQEGLDQLKQIFHDCHGERPLVTKEPRPIKREKHKEIKREFNGVNYKELARKHNMKERHVRRIVDNKSM